jgi:thiol-disulfide isomerase/thioredoxin
MRLAQAGAAALLLAASLHAADVRVRPIGAKQMKEILAKHKGRVLVVNLWATWCAPCRKELPDLLRLQADFEARGLRLIGISQDEPEDLQGKVVPLLRDEYPGFVSYIAKRGDDPVKLLDPEWDQVMPTTYVFDRAGKLKAQLSGSQTYERFKAAVEPLF